MLHLIIRSRERLLGFPVERVCETMRPPAIEPLRDAPVWVVGAAVIRGMAIPIVDAGSLLGDTPSGRARLVTLKVAPERVLGMLVDEILGLEAIEGIADLEQLIPLIASPIVARLAQSDGRLLSLLDVARVVPSQVFEGLSS